MYFHIFQFFGFKQSLLNLYVTNRAYSFPIFSGAKSKLSSNSNPSASYSQYDNGNANGNHNSNHNSSSSSATTSNANRKINASGATNTHSSGETLDLADLDLSQLRFTKKDLEVLSTLTPNLPKHFQDQLLAQLPPNQARKLSRTLSMQATGQQNPSHAHKRSLSSGRDFPMASDHTHSVGKSNHASPAAIPVESPLALDRKTILRRSLSRGREPTAESVPNTGQIPSSARNGDQPNRFSFAGDLSNRHRSNDFVSAIPSYSMRNDYYSRLPPKTSSNEALDTPIRRRSSTRCVSRFLRPDFYDSTSNLSINIDDNNCVKARRERERETQSVLREIRERSRDRARRDSISYADSANERPTSMAATTSDKTENAMKDAVRKKSIPNIRITVDKQSGRIYHARNKSLDLEDAADCNKNEPHRSNVSEARNWTAKSNSTINPTNDYRKLNDEDNVSFADQIIDELVQKSQEITARNSSEGKEVAHSASKKLKTKIKDGKKLKTKSKSVEDDSKKAVADNVNNIEMVTALTNEIESVTLPFPKTNASKLVRPKSYPSKDEKDGKKVIESADTLPSGNVPVESKIQPKLADPIDVSVEVTLRPKSYPNSKLTPPKETAAKMSKKSSPPSSSGSNESTNSKNAITAAVERFIEKAERLSPVKSMIIAKSKVDSNGEVSTTPKLTQKKVKVVRKVKSEQSSTTDEPTGKKSTDEVKETKSPEKKIKSGFLYSIGQKFEKMRENSRNKEKKISKSTVSPPTTESSALNTVRNDSNGISLGTAETNETSKMEMPAKRVEPKSVNAAASNTIKSEQRKSRIDAMIRNLRERSVPHTLQSDATSLSTESGLIKRAVSVEDMTNDVPNFNKCNVNKVLGLFRRIEREQQQQQQLIRSPSSTNKPVMEGLSVENADANKERPKSGSFVSKLKRTGRPYYAGAKSDTIITLTDKLEKQNQGEKLNASTVIISKIPQPKGAAALPLTKNTNESENCPECGTNDCKDIKGINEENLLTDSRRLSYNVNSQTDPQIRTLRETQVSTSNAISDKERIRNNRKGLILDLNLKIANLINNNNYPSENHSTHINNNGETMNHIVTASNNNYDFHNLPSETKMTGHSANYSSDSRSLRDDCESTSTFLSPTDEPELYFDDWSVCSSSVDDHSRLSPAPMHEHTKYQSSARPTHQYGLYPKSLTSSSHRVDVTPSTSDTESVIDRIKRRSFYCRFNEKKPKRTSSIVGPAARDYYRDIASSKAKSKSSDAATFRTQSKSPTPMNRTEPGTISPTSKLDDFHHYHTPRSSRYDDHRLDRPPRSGDYSSLRSTLTSPPASTTKYSSLNGNNRPYSTRNSNYDGLTPSASSSSTTSSTTPFIYGTYSPKRRISTSYLTPSIAALNSNGAADHYHNHHHHLTNNGYATLGHRGKPKAYDQRSISMLDSSSMPSSMYGVPNKRFTSAADQFGHSRFEFGNFNSR